MIKERKVMINLSLLIAHLLFLWMNGLLSVYFNDDDALISIYTYEKKEKRNTHMPQINERKRLTFFFQYDNLVPVRCMCMCTAGARQ